MSRITKERVGEGSGAGGEKPLSMNGYVFRPEQVAATLRARAEAGHSHALWTGPDEIGVGSRERPLFRLRGDLLESPFGRASLPSSSAASPDLLWESQDGICSHMEVDHADTFPTFLALLEQTGPSTGMPWVEAQGFFLSRPDDYVFLPFPTACQDANSVRATLIKILRKARASHG